MPFEQLKRREFFTLLGGAAAVWPFATHAQQPERMRRIGVLMSIAADDAEGQARLMAFGQGLAQLGWTVGRNVRIDARWAAGKADDIRKYATELVALAPDVILAAGGSVVGPLLQVTGTVPIVFTQVNDPVGAGFVSSLARPGGNATGFMSFEYGISGKWLELLKQIAPGVTRAAVLRDPAIAGGVGQLGAIPGVGSLTTAEDAIAPILALSLWALQIRSWRQVRRFARGYFFNDLPIRFRSCSCRLPTSQPWLGDWPLPPKRRLGAALVLFPVRPSLRTCNHLPARRWFEKNKSGNVVDTLGRYCWITPTQFALRSQGSNIRRGELSGRRQDERLSKFRMRLPRSQTPWMERRGALTLACAAVILIGYGLWTLIGWMVR